MARPRIDNTRAPEQGPDVRLVEVYSVSASKAVITAATNASPIVIATSAAHGFATGASVQITGVTGNTAANGTFTVTSVDSTHFSLNGTTGSGAYSSGGLAGLAQPVRVKMLYWGGSDYATYGADFPIGDATTVFKVGDRLKIVWRVDSRRWEPISSNEKARALRGNWYSGTTTLQVDTIVVLDSGTDPRANPGDATEQVAVVNVPGDTYAGGDRVYADWSVVNNRWEARPKSSGSEKNRLIRGTVYAAVGAAATTLDLINVAILAGGLDPRMTPGDATEHVTVANLLKENFGAGDVVTAIWNAAASQWEVLEVEKYRLIRGTVYSSVTAASSTVIINNVQVLSGGTDPRTDPTDATEHVTLQKINKEALQAGDRVTGIYNDTAQQWEVLTVERYRSCRGTWYSGTSTLLVDHIVVLESGLDPRSDTTSNTETVSVDNPSGNRYHTGDPVEADYCVATGTWIARNKSDRYVAAGADDTAPATLIEKTSPTGTYDDSTDTLVTFEEFDDSGVKKVRGFLPGAATSGTEKKRLIYGTTTAAVAETDGSFDIDNVIVLAGGLDPRVTPGDPTEHVTILANQFVALAVADYVTAAWNQDAGLWEMLPTERFRIIRGIVKTDATSSDAIFEIDHIVPLCSGMDPRIDNTDATETVDIDNLGGVDYSAGQVVYAVYNQLNDHWEPFAPDKFRAIRGKYVAGTVPITIDHIVVLESGIDPRVDPTNDTETVNVFKIATSDTYAAGDDVWADYNLKDGVWEARPKPAAESILRWARVTSTIAAATGPAAAAWGDGEVKLQDATTGDLAATAIAVKNQWIGDVSTEYAVDSQVLVDIGQDPPRVVNGTCGFVVWE